MPRPTPETTTTIRNDLKHARELLNLEVARLEASPSERTALEVAKTAEIVQIYATRLAQRLAAEAGNEPLAVIGQGDSQRTINP
jgi:hypothetical protein